MGKGDWRALRLTEGRGFELASVDPGAKPASSGEKERDKAEIARLSSEISHLQDRFWARRDRKLLIVLQGTDTSGKDGTLRAVFRDVDPLGIRAVSYKAPVGPELDRDWLWRHHRDVPGKGEIVVFNRSHYEEVLVPVVRGWVDAEERRRRYRHIVHFEELLTDTGTTVLKFFLHISREEQRERLQERIDDPSKHWKFDRKDLAEREHFEAYQEAYEGLLRHTATERAPWWVVPADSKTHRNLLVARVVRDALAELAPDWPAPDPGLSGLVVT